MSRLVGLDGTEPRILDESDLDIKKGDIAVCQCGLSAEFPFCDGSHRATGDETDGVCYRYPDADSSDDADADGDRKRRRVDHVRYENEEIGDDTAETAVDGTVPDGTRRRMSIANVSASSLSENGSRS